MEDTERKIDLEKAPAVVSVKVIRKSKRKYSAGSAINVAYGMRCRKLVVPRTNRTQKSEIRVSQQEQNIKQYASNNFAKNSSEEQSKAGFHAYRKCLLQVEKAIDEALEVSVSPICERTVEEARKLESETRVPQFVPVIFHDATGMHCTDYFHYFHATVTRLQEENYDVVSLLPSDVPKFQKQGIWPTMLSLLLERKSSADKKMSEQGGGLNDARQILELRCKNRHSSLIIAIQPSEVADLTIWGELITALSEVWETLPSIVIVGQLVKAEYIHSNISKATLSKLRPITISVPGAYATMERLLKKLLFGKDNAFPVMSPGSIHYLCELLLQQHCGVTLVKRFMKTILLKNFIKNAENGHFGESSKKGNHEDHSLLQDKMSVRDAMLKFGICAEITAMMARHVTSKDSLYIHILKEGINSFRKDTVKEMWGNDSLLFGIKELLLKSKKDSVETIIRECLEVTKKVLESGAYGSVKPFIQKLMTSFDSLLIAEEAMLSSSMDKEKLAESRGQAPKYNGRSITARRVSRRQALKELVSSLAETYESETAHSIAESENCQAKLATLMVSMWDDVSKENTCECKFPYLLSLDCAVDEIRDILFPSVPMKVLSSLKKSTMYLKQEECSNMISKDMEDAVLVYHFLEGLSGNFAVDEIFEHFCNTHSVGENQNTRRRRNSSASRPPKSNKHAEKSHQSENRDILNARFERALQELKLCGLIRIQKRKLNKLITPVIF